METQVTNRSAWIVGKNLLACLLIFSLASLSGCVTDSTGRPQTSSGDWDFDRKLPPVGDCTQVDGLSNICSDQKTMRRIVAALVDYHDASFRKNYNSNMKEVIKNIDEIQISKKGGLFDINIKYAYGVIRSGRQSGNDSRTSRQFSTDSDFSVTSMGGHGSGRFVRPPRISREQERTSTERSNPTRENRATSRDRVVPDASTSETTRPVESSPAPAAPPKPMYEPGEVRLIAQNVDDIMEIFLDDAKVAECRWAGTGCGAGWKGVLKDRHKVRFKLTNVPYTGFCMTQPCGKWSADMLVMVEDKKIWSNGVFGRENDAGVKYDVTLTCDFTKGLCIE